MSHSHGHMVYPGSSHTIISRSDEVLGFLLTRKCRILATTVILKPAKNHFGRKGWINETLSPKM